jgi:thymidylate synthase (FAD)
VRHRIASYNQQSQRYVKESNFDYIIPPSIEANEEAKKRFISQMNYIQSMYNSLIADGINKEDARYLLPNACETKIIVTINARSLNNFFKLRCAKDAQWEIRELANEMKKLVTKVHPNIWSE